MIDISQNKFVFGRALALAKTAPVVAPLVERLFSLDCLLGKIFGKRLLSIL